MKKLKQEQSQMKLYAEQVAQLLATEKNLRLQLIADVEKFQQFQEALLKSDEVFETFKQEIEKVHVHNISKKIFLCRMHILFPYQTIYHSCIFMFLKLNGKIDKEENTFLKSKCDKSDVTLIEHADKKQLEKTRNQKEKLESLCQSLQAERKTNSNSNPNSVGANTSDSAPVLSLRLGIRVNIHYI